MNMIDRVVREWARCRRGGVLLFVLISVAVATIGGVTVLLSATAARSTAVVLSDLARARQSAESGLFVAAAYMESEPDWRFERTPGRWVSDLVILGSRVSIDAAYESDGALSIELLDASFESEAVSLANPLLFPPMSGTIGGWDVSRSALLETGFTVPLIGVRAASSSTDGSHSAYITFGASVTGSGSFSQTLPIGLEANRRYTIGVDMGVDGLPPIDSSFGYRVYAGGTLLATTRESYTVLDGVAELLGDVSEIAESLLVGGRYPSSLVCDLLSGSNSRYALTFETGEIVPPGALRVEFFAESVGVLSTVTFDNASIRSQGIEPITVRSVASYGEASHGVTVTIGQDLVGGCRILDWVED